MHFDVVIIGAGMSGLAAGIRLAMFDKRVCILEKHYAYGGLNSYYTLNGRRFDVGLHALTNYSPPEKHTGPLAKLLRQLRIRREELDLCEQRGSEIRFPGRRLRFTNDIRVLTDEVAREFPGDADRFVRFLKRVGETEFGSVHETSLTARTVLCESLGDPVLIEMLLCAVMYYGSPRAHDMEFGDFVNIFRSIYCEGFARPRDGILGLLKPLVKKFRSSGGKLRMQCGVERINLRKDRVESLTLESGETLTADTVISSAGWDETLRLCRETTSVPYCGTEHSSRGTGSLPARGQSSGRLTFVESFLVLDRPPAELGFGETVLFFNDSDMFTYAPPQEPVDLRSGVFCCPNNYERHDHWREGLVRLTWLANHQAWVSLEPESYAALKRQCLERVFEQAEKFIPGVRERVVFSDMFTPRTIEAFTGHIGGAVYGSPQKSRDGRTPVQNLFLCGTDQGYVGIIGALMSGVMMANMHVLSQS